MKIEINETESQVITETEPVVKVRKESSSCMSAMQESLYMISFFLSSFASDHCLHMRSNGTTANSSEICIRNQGLY